MVMRKLYQLDKGIDASIKKFANEMYPGSPYSFLTNFLTGEGFQSYQQEKRKKESREQKVPQSGGPQPYYYGTPTPRGTPLPGSAPPEERIWRKWLFDEALPGIGKNLLKVGTAVTSPDIYNLQLSKSDPLAK